MRIERNKLVQGSRSLGYELAEEDFSSIRFEQPEPTSPYSDVTFHLTASGFAASFLTVEALRAAGVSDDLIPFDWRLF